jgi:hypothetical protein
VTISAGTRERAVDGDLRTFVEEIKAAAVQERNLIVVLLRSEQRSRMMRVIDIDDDLFDEHTSTAKRRDYSITISSRTNQRSVGGLFPPEMRGDGKGEGVRDARRRNNDSMGASNHYVSFNDAQTREGACWSQSIHKKHED